MVCDLFTESLIKGIIVSNSRTGITIPKIANMLYECSGECWPGPNKGESHAIRYLEQIDGVLSIVNEKNEQLWYVRGKTLNNGMCGQIYRANNQPKSDFDLSSNPHGNIPDTCIQTNGNSNTANPNTNMNNNNFRLARNSKSKVERNHNGYNGINGNYEPRNAVNQWFDRRQKHHTDNRLRVNGRRFGSPRNNESSSTADSAQRTSATLYNYNLVGDDFFMELSKIDLGCNATNRRRIHRCGLCISGQTIRDATENLKRIPHPENMKIIVNLGSVDILHGRDLPDMCQDFINLTEVCEVRKIQMIVTTLAPLANRMYCFNDTTKTMKFNDFLMKRLPKNFEVIDIAPCTMHLNSNKILYECYQPSPKYVSGSDQPHLLWNRIGRQRILKLIKSQLRI